ncbi:MAG: hypothetical protein ACOCRK_04505 [bacterium]
MKRLKKMAFDFMSDNVYNKDWVDEAIDDYHNLESGTMSKEEFSKKYWSSNNAKDVFKILFRLMITEIKGIYNKQDIIENINLIKEKMNELSLFEPIKNGTFTSLASAINYSIKDDPNSEKLEEEDLKDDHTDPIIENYQDILDGVTKKFYNGTWKPKSIGKNNAAKLVKYYVEEYKGWTPEDVKRELTWEQFSEESKLRTAIDSIFNGSPYLLINNAYPGEFKPWDLKGLPKDNNPIWQDYFNSDDHIIEGIKWMVEERLGVSPNSYEDLQKITENDFTENRLSFILEKFNNDPQEALKFAYPSLYEEKDFDDIVDETSKQPNVIDENEDSNVANRIIKRLVKGINK